jgi:hypothetical protein
MRQNFDPSARKSSAPWVSGALLVLALALAFGPVRYENIVSEPTEVPAGATDTSTVWQPRPKPEALVGLDYHRCSLCHDSKRPPPSAAGKPTAEASKTAQFPEILLWHPKGRHVTCHDEEKPTKHAEVALEHGMNTNCFNCHHPTNRDAFVDEFGREIPWDQPQLMCGKCHGLVYRDWQHGAHGRVNGYWDQTAGAQTRVKCIACHRPHHPPFPPMEPAPGPNTLRTGPEDHGVHAKEHNPLRLRVGSTSERTDSTSEKEKH